MVGVIFITILLPFLFSVKKKVENKMVDFKDKPWFDYVKDICHIHDVPSKIILAQIEQESNGNENAISSADAKGLMQIKEIVLKEYNEENNVSYKDLFNPFTNIAIGVWYLKKMFTIFGNYHDALMAYSNGIGNYRKYLNKTISTLPHKDYADEVLKKANILA